MKYKFYTIILTSGRSLFDVWQRGFLLRLALRVRLLLLGRARLKGWSLGFSILLVEPGLSLPSFILSVRYKLAFTAECLDPAIVCTYTLSRS